MGTGSVSRRKNGSPSGLHGKDEEEIIADMQAPSPIDFRTGTSDKQLIWETPAIKTS